MRDSLTELKVANNCPASWRQMRGDDVVRNCSQCNRKVYNLSNMTRAEAVDLIDSTESKVCVRYYRRSDGMVMTKDCGRAKRAWTKVAAVLASNLAILGLTFPTMAQGQLKTPDLILHSDLSQVKLAKKAESEASTAAEKAQASQLVADSEQRLSRDRARFHR